MPFPATLKRPTRTNRGVAQQDFMAGITVGSLAVRLADGAADIDAAQSLRYRVFYEEMTARPSDEMASKRRDIDSFDGYCDHLVVIGRERARDSELRPIIILLTDGVANVGLSAGSDPISDAMSSAYAIALDAVPALVVDADRRREHSSPLPDLAKRMRATHVRLDALAAGQLTHLIRLATN